MTVERPELSHEYVERRFGTRLAPDEVPLYACSRFWFFLVRRMALFSPILIPALMVIWGVARGSIVTLSLPLAVIGLVYLLVVLVTGLYLYRDWHDDALIITDRRLIYVEQVILISRRQQEILLSNIQNVRFDVRGLVARLLDYGDIKIETAARRSDITFGPIRHPDVVQEQILERVRALRTRTSTRLMEETLLYRLGRRREPPEVPGVAVLEQERPPRYTLGLSGLLLPNPRVEGDTVTWYKHWYFLLRRLLFPFLTLVGMGVVAFLLPSWNAPPLLWGIWGLGVLLVLGFLVVRYQLWKGDMYVVTADSLHDIYRTPWGLFGETRRSAGLERIQNISFLKPNLIANLLDFGDIRIETAGAEEFSFLGLPRPEQVQREIYRRQELFRLRREQRQREEIADWLVAYRQVDRRLEEEQP